MLNTQNKMSESSKRFEWADLLKSIAMLCVIIYHSTLYSSDITMQSAGAGEYVNYLLRTLLSTCVPMFFFINGFLSLGKEFDLKKHIIKTARLLLLALFWGVVTLLVLMVVNNEYMTLKELFKGLWFWRSGWINHIWYIGALIGIYIFYPLLKSTYDTNKKAFIYFTAICTALTFGNTLLNEIMTLLSGTVYQGFNFFNIFNPFRNSYGYALAYFCLGGIMVDGVEKIKSIPKIKRNVIAVVVMILSCLSLWGMGIALTKTAGECWELVWNGYDTVFTLFNVLSMLVLSLNFEKGNHFITLISQNTLGIYFLHRIPIHATQMLILNVPFLCNFPFNVIYAFAVLCICLAASMLMRKIPYIGNLV